ncbi:unnamed protein product [Nyctereutes procyonoides]|uniref:(raccoon dog) hypothetical protein n=1 Tax=Nyctereutes procyonoides TaxID=34880 RepID=A0A811Y2V3_NYCPR|nr:unnamed protein product [Nyctereutes procyonoides]
MGLLSTEVTLDSRQEAAHPPRSLSREQPGRPGQPPCNAPGTGTCFSPPPPEPGPCARGALPAGPAGELWASSAPRARRPPGASRFPCSRNNSPVC